MYQFARINNPRVAQSFIDYLATQNIEIFLHTEPDQVFSLWYKEEQHKDRVEEEWQRFVQEPNHARYQSASWQVTSARSAPAFSYQTPSLWKMLKDKAGLVTLGLMLFSILVYAFQHLIMPRQTFALFHFPLLPEQGLQLWRWFSHAFLHFSIIHIAFNLMWWWQLGGDVERRLGSRTLTVLLLVSAFASGLAQYLVGDIYFGGLSGVVYGLVGFVWMVGWYRPDLKLSIPKPILGFMLVWLILGYAQSWMPIANSAHLAGLVSGIIMGVLRAKWRY
jgi:GlpG protein